MRVLQRASAGVLQKRVHFARVSLRGKHSTEAIRQCQHMIFDRAYDICHGNRRARAINQLAADLPRARLFNQRGRIHSASSRGVVGRAVSMRALLGKTLLLMRDETLNGLAQAITTPAKSAAHATEHALGSQNVNLPRAYADDCSQLIRAADRIGVV